MRKYYAFVTPDAIGIFTSWADVESIAVGTPGGRQKSFHSYEEAKKFVLSDMSDMDMLDFGLDKNPLYLNKKFVRKAQYIAEKEAKSRGEQNVRKHDYIAKKKKSTLS